MTPQSADKSRPRLTAHLACLPAMPRLAVLIASLPLTQGSERRDAIADLLDLGAELPEPARSQAVQAVAAYWRQLDTDQRAAFTSLAASDWGSLAASLTGPDAEPDAPATLAELAASTRAAPLIAALPKLLLHDADESGAAAHAAHADRVLVRLAHEDPSDPALVSALVLAAESFAEHTRRGILVAILQCLGDPGTCPPLLRSILEDRDHPAAKALRGALRYSNMPALRSQAWKWLRTEHLAAACLDRLARSVSDEEHELVLSASHLLLHPARAARMRMLETRPRVVAQQLADRTVETVEPPRASALPEPERVPALSNEARRGLARFAAAVPTSLGVRRAVTDPLLTDPLPAVRYAAMLAAPPADRQDFAFDRHPAVARSAMLKLSRLGSRSRRPSAPRLRLAEHLTRSPHEPVRRLARQEQADLDPLAPGARSGSLARVAARRALETDRDAFLSRLAAAIEAGDPERRLRAVQLAGFLQLAPELEEPLERALGVHGGDPIIEPKVAASAAMTLGQSPTDRARAALLEAVSAADDRVRANAAEALADPHRAAPSTDPEVYQTLIELKHDGHHRVRAGATASLLRRSESSDKLYEPAAVEGLGSLMGDDRAEHRLAGTWLAELALSGRGPERLGLAWPELVRRLERLAVDKDDAVCTRAERALHRVTLDRRQRWASTLTSTQAGGIHAV